MRNILILFILLLICNSESSSQGLFVVTSNKTNYSYGETIEVYIKMFNNTDTTLTYWIDVFRPVWLEFNNVGLQIMGSTADGELYFAPGVSRTWTWKLDPTKLGIPVHDGQQEIRAYGFGQKDTIKITAPKYFGGRLNVDLKLDVSKDEIQQLRETMHVSVLTSDTLSNYGILREKWQISELSIDSLVLAYDNDYRIKVIEADRSLKFDNMIITFISSLENIPNQYSLLQNYPNPFNPSTVIGYQLPVSGFVTLKVFDLLGREVATLVNEYLQAGQYVETFHGTSLPSGIYFYQLKAGNFVDTKKFVLQK